MSYWSDIAVKTIDKALEEGRKQGLDGKALVAFVDARYPFEYREMYPYKMWIKVRRKRLELERLIPKRPAKKVEWPAPPTPLFDR